MCHNLGLTWAFCSIKSHGVFNGRLFGTLKHDALDCATVSSISSSGVADLFKHAWNTQNQVRAGTLQFQSKGAEIRPVGLGCTGDSEGQVHCASKNVRQRKEGEQP